jgi:hypothetical protein
MHNTFKISLLAITSIILLSACGQLDPDSETALAYSEQGPKITNLSEVDSSLKQSTDLNSDESTSNIEHSSDMVSFDGVVFVATTDLDEYLWQIAGWRISQQELDTENSDIPQDCTLYPHQGVSDQWVGSCAGYILVPKNGAKHIAVMVTDDKGSTNMVQVAP